MTCIRTGARVHFVEWGVVHAADIHQVGECYVINCSYKDFYVSHSDEPTHEVIVGQGYDHKLKQIFVVPGDNLKDLENEP